MTKLDERRKLYNIPELPYLPAYKVVLVFRLPSETRTAGGLYVPDEHREPKPMGVLLGAGLAALDIMRDHLIEVGDVVWFGHFAGWEKEIERDPEGTGRQILQLKVDELLGSVDALERIGTTHSLAYDDDEGQHSYEEKVRNGSHGKRTRVPRTARA